MDGNINDVTVNPDRYGSFVTQPGRADGPFVTSQRADLMRIEWIFHNSGEFPDELETLFIAQKC